jgi:hypothetical protein
MHDGNAQVFPFVHLREDVRKGRHGDLDRMGILPRNLDGIGPSDHYHGMCGVVDEGLIGWPERDTLGPSRRRTTAFPEC